MAKIEDVVDNVNSMKGSCEKIRDVVLDELTDDDAGAQVVYIPSAGNPEYGRISSWNKTYVFVLFNTGITAAACNPKDLVFVKSNPR